MVRLTLAQLEKKEKFINDYISAKNAADGSKMDANANVSTKNLATLSAELHKDINIQINRERVQQKIKELYGEDLAKEYLDQIERGEIYCHDETSILPYCVSISMYPFLTHGLTLLGGESKAPKHLNSFCGNFVNLVFSIASQFAGAVATVEFLMCFDYFARKDYGDNYLETHTDVVANALQHVVYALNQPAAARGYQSVFWNISLYDEQYFNAMFENFVFPDTEFSRPSYESLEKLQRFFLSWINKERTKAILTFPVITVACLTDGKKPLDTAFEEVLAKELSEGNSFFIFMSDNAASLSSCCRLKNSIEDQINDFSYSLGCGGVSTGSKNVITININRLIQDGRSIEEQVSKIHKYQTAHNAIFEEYFQAKMLPVFDAGFISLDKQFLTIGINGVVEAAEYLGYTISNNDDYKNWLKDFLKTISDLNSAYKKETGLKINTECIPGENVAYKFAKKDKKDGYTVPRDIYNSYFYIVEDNEPDGSLCGVSVLDKFTLHGHDTSKFLDGGSAAHINLESAPDKDTFKLLIRHAAVVGCEYFCFNVKITICNVCENIDKRTLAVCPKCGSTDIDYGTRIIGYLKRVSAFSTPRQKEAALRHYHKAVA